MSTLSENIEKRMSEITGEIALLEKNMRNAPEGHLRISKCRKYPRFYRVTKKGDTSGEYLPAADKTLVGELAQKDYEAKVMRMLQKEQKLLSGINDYYKKTSPDGDEFFSGPEELLPSKMIETRRNLIREITKDQRRFIEEWMEEEYEKKGFADNAPEYYTSSGIRVRSKTEWMIAEMLEKKGVPFHYEKPLLLKGLGKIHPDFTVLNVKHRKCMYWEHLGMMDDEQYCTNALHKIECYTMNGLLAGDKLILTHETSKTPIRSQMLEKTIEVYLLT